MGNLQSGDEYRLISFGRVKTPCRFTKYQLFIKDIEGLVPRLAANAGGKGGAR